jgi:hypothetical protein
MSPLLAPTAVQIEGQIASILAKTPDQRVVGIRSPVRRPWPELVHVQGQNFRLHWCESTLELRDRLDALDCEADGRAVLITPLDDAAAGWDVLARLPRAKLMQISRWDALRNVFKVRDLDPRLAKQEWLVDLLLDRVPNGGYPAVSTGILDLDTAWRIAVSQLLQVPDGRPDATALIRWTSMDGDLGRFRTLPDEARTRIAERLAVDGGPAVDLIMAAIEAGRAADVLAIGLVCTAVFSVDTLDDAARETAVRMESFFGGREITASAGAALAQAARRVIDRGEITGVQALAQHARAATLLVELRAIEQARRSPVLFVGYERRLVDAAAALVNAAQSGLAADLDAAAKLVRAVVEHDRSSEQISRTHRVEMATRLCRWLATQPLQVNDFVTAAASYAREGGFVDQARHTLRPGDPLPDVAAAYARIRELAAARRETENHRFAVLLLEWNNTGTLGGGALPVERVLDGMVAPLAKHKPILFLVFDGLSFAVNGSLVSRLAGDGWMEITPRGGVGMMPVVAGLPTITEVSRTSLLCGTFTAGGASAESAGFSAHAGLREASQAGKPPVLFHKGDLGGGPELASVVADALADRGRRVVGIVHNAIDAQLSGSDQLEVSWSVESLRQIGAILRIARESDRLVVVTGDHGHVFDEGTVQTTSVGGDRWRPPGPLRQGEIEFRGGRVLAPSGGNAVVAAWSERIRYSAKRAGYHGGVSPQEVLVPLSVLTAGDAPADWVEKAPAEPGWWRDDAPMHVAPPAAVSPSVPRASRRPGQPQPDLFSRAPVPPAREDDWIDRLFASPTYETQKRLAGRGAPSDDNIRQLVKALDARGGRLSRDGLAQALSLPTFRAGGLVNASRRVLNVDQAQVLSLDAASGEVRLDIRLLRIQFSLEDRP